MIRKKIPMVLVLFGILSHGSIAHTTDITLKNNFTFYGDNTEFFEPFRTRETILGQQGKSWFEAQLGPSSYLLLGALGDFRSYENPAITIDPILGFEYRNGNT